jgi:hypothetical protein
MKLNDKCEIKKTKYGYTLFRAVRNMNPKTKKMVDGLDETYYSTMDQALIGFVNHSIGCPETIDELKVKIISIRDLIVSLREDIISQRGDIRSVKP